MGWEPAEVTTYEYDDDGRVVRAVTVREPEFSAYDRALFYERWQLDKEPRGSHGMPLSETTDPDNRYAYDVPRNEKGVPTPITDYAQEALDKAQAEYRSRFPDEHMGSKLWRVRKKDQPRSA